MKITNIKIKLMPKIVPVSILTFNLLTSFNNKYNCSEKIYFEIGLIVSLNIESIGKKENTIITGTVTEVAII